MQCSGNHNEQKLFSELKRDLAETFSRSSAASFDFERIPEKRFAPSSQFWFVLAPPHIKSFLPRNEPFSNQGFLGMLDAKKMDDVNKVLPFLGAIANEYCDSGNVDSTRKHKLYVDVVLSLYMMCKIIEGSKKELAQQRARTRKYIKKRKYFRNTKRLVCELKNSMHCMAFGIL